MSKPSDILSTFKADLDKGLIPLAMFGDPDIYRLELRRIFSRAWVFIGHETEIPHPGDYALRYIGEDPFIFVRDKGGAVRVLFNACRHRGTQVCRAEKGNTEFFTCPYHGWTYRNNGELVGVPARNEGYRQLNLVDWGLFAAPQVATYCGLVFANLDPHAPSFDAYIGKYRFYLDMQFCLSEGGMEVIGEPHRWLTSSNWKQGAENFNGDSSHTSVVHRSALNAGVVGAEAAGPVGKTHGLHVSQCDGHAISMRLLEKGRRAFWMYPEEVTRHFRPGALNDLQFDLAGRGVAHDGTVFPNFSFLHAALSDSAERPAAGFLTLRVWQPRGPDKTEIWNWILAPKEASADYKHRAYRLGMSSFSPSGSFEPDDIAVFGSIARSGSTMFARANNVKLNYQMGLGEMSDVAPIADWQGPGIATASNAGEAGLRTFHDSWYRHMRDDAARGAR